MRRNLILSKYVGCLVGGVVGDCLGSPYEAQKPVKVGQIIKDLERIETGPMKVKKYTDDTAMARSLAKTLISEHRAQDNWKVDQKALARRFTEEYFKDPGRGYGKSIANVFSSLLHEDYANPTGPAACQFDGSGSYGNGTAMRVAPAALYGENLSSEHFNELVKDTCTVTHSHRDAINGGILLATAIRIASKLDPAEKLNSDSFLYSLNTEMEKVELFDRKGGDTPEMPYCAKLVKIKELLSEEASADQVVETLGHHVSAMKSVPTAIYVFLRAQNPIKGIERDNVIERMIIYTISLGGDTDTIASMAGALAGAFYGIEGIKSRWQDTCEGVEDAKQYAEQLFHINYGKDSEEIT